MNFFRQIELADTYYAQFFKDIKIRQCMSTRNFCLACLLSFYEQASLAKLARQGGLSDQKLKWTSFFGPYYLESDEFHPIPITHEYQFKNFGT